MGQLLGTTMGLLIMYFWVTRTIYDMMLISLLLLIHIITCRYLLLIYIILADWAIVFYFEPSSYTISVKAMGAWQIFHRVRFYVIYTNRALVVVVVFIFIIIIDCQVNNFAIIGGFVVIMFIAVVIIADNIIIH